MRMVLFSSKVCAREKKIAEGHLLEKKQLQCMFWIPKSEKTFLDFSSQLWTLHACAACIALGFLICYYHEKKTEWMEQ